MKINFSILLLLPLFFSCGKKSGTPGSPAKASFEDVSVIEGTGASYNLELKVTLDKASSGQVTLRYSTVDGTAKAGTDFTGISNQTLSFAANETEKKILVNIIADDIKEGDETFGIRIDEPVNAILVKGTLNVVLRNDDTKIAFNNSGFDAPISYPGYTLAWADEFNAGSLDATAWSSQIGDGCPGLCGWGNNELQYYTSPPNNLFFQDGKMIIEAKSETFGGKNYTSARINTESKKSFRFGRIDVRAILPKGKGIWPAFWLLPQDRVFGDWPRSGEIDMMENIGSEPSRVLGTLHYGPGPGSTYMTKNFSLSSGTFNDEFHVFSLEWQQDQIKWLVDGNVYATISKADIGGLNWPFNERFYFLINMAVGGNLPGAPDASTVYPQHLIVDYLRVYQK